jgi:hypothetical protein
MLRLLRVLVGLVLLWLLLWPASLFVTYTTGSMRRWEAKSTALGSVALIPINAGNVTCWYFPILKRWAGYGGPIHFLHVDPELLHSKLSILTDKERLVVGRPRDWVSEVRLKHVPSSVRFMAPQLESAVRLEPVDIPVDGFAWLPIFHAGQ